MNIKELFENHSLEIGIWDTIRNEDILWETKILQDEEPYFVFYEQERKIRNCLVTTSYFSTVKAIHILGDQLSLDNIIQFLNVQLFTFDTIDISLSKAGKLRQKILENFFDMRPKFPNVNEYVYLMEKNLCETTCFDRSQLSLSMQ